MRTPQTKRCLHSILRDLKLTVYRYDLLAIPFRFVAESCCVFCFCHAFLTYLSPCYFTLPSRSKRITGDAVSAEGYAHVFGGNEGLYEALCQATKTHNVVETAQAARSDASRKSHSFFFSLSASIECNQIKGGTQQADFFLFRSLFTMTCCQ
jgi:hypothetical protein